LNTNFAASLYALSPSSAAPEAKSVGHGADELEVAAQQFEALFLQDMLKSMRSASLGGALGDSDQTKLFRELHDKQLASSLGASGSIGIADLIVRQLRGLDRSAPGDLYAPQPAVAGPQLHDPIRSKAPASDASSAEEAGASPVTSRATNAQALDPRRVNNAEERVRFESPTEFIRVLWSDATEAGNALGLPPDVLIAQAALETGWGRHFPRDSNGQSSRNLFGIKAGRSWDGPKAVVTTLEFDAGVAQPTQAAFRAYGDFGESFRDYVDLLRGNSRYADALQRVADTPRFLDSLQHAGYATDPEYASKIKSILAGETMSDALHGLKFSRI